MNIGFPSMIPTGLGPLDAASTQRDARAEETAVKDLSREFEAVLVRQILKQAHKTTLASGAESSSGPGGMYRDMATEQLASAIADSGGLGFAKAFEQQLTRQTISHENDEND